MSDFTSSEYPNVTGTIYLHGKSLFLLFRGGVITICEVNECGVRPIHTKDRANRFRTRQQAVQWLTENSEQLAREWYSDSFVME